MVRIPGYKQPTNAHYQADLSHSGRARAVGYTGVPKIKIRANLFGGLYSMDYSILESILGCHQFGKLVGVWLHVRNQDQPPRPKP